MLSHVILSSLAAAVVAAESVISTVTDHTTTTGTITSCSDDACATTSSSSSLAPVATVTEHTTTTGTITSCSDNACVTSSSSLAPTYNNVTVVTVLETYYTTYCPESGVTTVVPVTEEKTVTKTVKPSSLAPAVTSSSDSYVDVTVTPTSTASEDVEITVTLQSTLTRLYSSSKTSAPANVTSYEGSAGRNAVGVVGLAVLAALL